MVTLNGDFFEDVMVEILLRLPVKSLLRFKCVCKSWYDLVKNYNFISKHLKNDENTRLVVIYTEVDYADEFGYPVDLFCLFPDQTLTDLTLQDLEPQLPIQGMIGGPYGGIFCIFGMNNRVTLWNLATRESRALPKCRATLPPYSKVFRTNVGFGFDPMRNDYKMVLILTLSDEKRNMFYEFTHVAVYTLSTNSWKDFEGFKSSQYHMPWSFDSTYLDGACYWLLEIRSDYHKLILSFHMGDEEFQEIEGPHIPESAPMTLGLYDAHLSFLLLDTIKNFFDIWVMKERSWNKQLTVGPFTEVRRPLGFWKKGSFFVESSSDQLLMYEPSTQQMRELGLKSSWFSVYNYKESLVTLKVDDSLLDFFEIPWHILGLYQTDSYSS